MKQLRPAWARTYHHELSDRERALRLLWSPLVTEQDADGEWVVPDSTIAWIDRVLGLSEQHHNTHHNTAVPQYRITVTT